MNTKVLFVKKALKSISCATLSLLPALSRAVTELLRDLKPVRAFDCITFFLKSQPATLSSLHLILPIIPITYSIVQRS